MLLPTLDRPRTHQGPEKKEGTETMDAHEYLVQVRMLNRRIKNKMMEVAHLREMATGVRAISYEEKVQSAGDADPLGHAVLKIIELEEEITRTIDEYVDKKREIMKAIDGLTDPDEYDVIYKFYVEEKSIQEIADETHYSTKSVARIKKRALGHISVP